MTGQINKSLTQEITFSFLINLFLYCWKLILAITLLSTFIGYIYFTMSNQERFEATGLMEIGTYEVEPFHFVAIEGYDNLQSYVETNYILLPQFNSEKSLISSIDKVFNDNNKIFISLKSQEQSKKEASENVKRVMEFIELRHSKIKDFELDNLNIKMESLDSTISFNQELINNNIKQKMDLKNNSVHFEYLLNLDQNLHRLNELIFELNIQKESTKKIIDAYNSYNPSKQYGVIESKTINSHNLGVSLFSFFLIGITTSILVVVSRFFIKIEPINI